MHYREEKLSEEFTKHVLDFPAIDGIFHTAIHHFTGRDRGYPHNHPFSFYSFIGYGGYIEKVYKINPDGTWYTEEIERKPNTCHFVEDKHIHEIIHLYEKECWTITVLQPHSQNWSHFDFREDAVYHRLHGTNEFVKYLV